MIRAVIFDMDGVIVDSHGVSGRVFTEIVNQELNLDITEEEIMNKPGMRFENRVKEITDTKGLNIDFEKILDAINKARFEYHSNGLSYVRLFDGVIDLFEELKKNNIKIALGTNASRNSAHKLMELLKVKEYFSSMVAYDDVKIGKPAPDIFLKNANNLGFKPDECIVIEDSISGITAAKNANMKVIGVASAKDRNEIKVADLVVEKISEINLGVIRKL